MRVKVCGMKNGQNIEGLLALNPNYIGFIFYENSPRFVGEELDENLLKSFPAHIKKVGVFVNANVEYITHQIKKYKLDYVQLSGHEKPDLCATLKKHGVGIIKAFKLDETFVWGQLLAYQPHVEYFLFDTPSATHGGTGQKFDWKLLEHYSATVPYFLAGGIGPEDALSMSDLPIQPFCLDVNSKFETEPGLKDLSLLKEFIETIRQETIAA